MSKFKVGDIAEANELSNNYYGLTNKKNEFVGEIVAVQGNIIELKTLIHIDDELIGELFELRSDCFELLADTNEKWVTGQKIEHVVTKRPYTVSFESSKIFCLIDIYGYPHYFYNIDKPLFTIVND